MINIRKFKEADEGPMYAAISQSAKELLPWMTWFHQNYSVEEVKEFIRAQPELWEKDQAYNFVIEDSETGLFLGAVGLNQINRQYQRANLGYWIKTDKTGHNIASQAARQAALFGIKQLGLERIEILAATINKGSCRVAEKAGAVQEGLLRNRVLIQGKLQDGFMYSIIRKDLEGKSDT